MKKRRIRDAAWYPNAVAISVGAAVYILLSRFPEIWSSVRTFAGFFSPVIVGCVIAYIVNPLAGLFKQLFKRIKKNGTRTLLANGTAFLVVVCFIVFTVWILIPQMIESGKSFVHNLKGYVASLNQMLESWGVSKKTIDLSGFIDSSESMLNSVSAFMIEHEDQIFSVSADAGKIVFRLVISFILSIYLLAEKPRLKAGARRLLKALFGEERYEEVHTLVRKCDTICSRYVISNLIDSLIVGGVNALFMTLLGMQYTGLISFVVAITNLVPTFGPMVGALMGGFILLMVNPIDALIFLGFTVILQTCDAYVIKPKLFGSSLGVSGLWIMVGVIAGGNMFGVVGILLAIPGVAIIDLLYGTYLIPYLEKKHPFQRPASAKMECTDEPAEVPDEKDTDGTPV